MRLLTVLLLLTTQFAFSQSGMPIGAGAKGIAMGNTGLNEQSINSIFSNQAGLAFLQGTHFALFGEQNFVGTGINDLAVGASHHIAGGTFGLSFRYYGIEEYKEQKIGLSYARKLFEKLSLGVQFDYLNTAIQEYGNAGVLTFEVGFISQLTKNFSVGASVYSPMRVALTDTEDIPSSLAIGISYKPSKKVEVNVETEKRIDYDLSVKAGFEYWVHPFVSIRLGANVNPSLATFGFGFKINNNFYLDAASSYHQELGFSPAFGLRYSIQNKNIAK